MAEARIGTSGWHYKHWRGLFYPADLPLKRWFAHYCAQFSTVEINTSFYHLLPEKAVREWVAQTPPDFVFAVKGSRYITHNKKLKDGESLRRFFDSLREFRGKLGPILFQLPPGSRCNIERLEEFLARLPKRHRYAFEFRNETWHDETVYRLLERFNSAFCLYHLAGFDSPLKVTADFIYIRLHGPEGKYAGCYSDEALAVWAKRIRGWKRAGKHVYCYFDNDERGYAARNALSLIEKLKGRRRATASHLR